MVMFFDNPLLLERNPLKDPKKGPPQATSEIPQRSNVSFVLLEGGVFFLDLLGGWGKGMRWNREKDSCIKLRLESLSSVYSPTLN